MKKKIITLLTLLLAVCSGAWATTETVYSWVSTGTSSTDVTETGGTASGKFGTVINYCMQLGDKYSGLKTDSFKAQITGTWFFKIPSLPSVA